MRAGIQFGGVGIAIARLEQAYSKEVSQLLRAGLDKKSYVVYNVFIGLVLKPSVRLYDLMKPVSSPSERVFFYFLW